MAEFRNIFVYNGSTWQAATLLVDDAGGWEEVIEAWVFNGLTWQPFYAQASVSNVATADTSGGTSCVVANLAAGTVTWTPGDGVLDGTHNFVVNIYLDGSGNGNQCATYTQIKPKSIANLSVKLWYFLHVGGAAHTVNWDWALVRVSDGAILQSGGYSGGVAAGGLTWETTAAATGCCAP